MSQSMIDGPLLDLVSHARRGPTGHAAISLGEVDHIRRTVTRSPEVMVKVLTRGGQDLKAVQRHLSYLDRGGELAFETDEGVERSGRADTAQLLEDWDLDLEAVRQGADLPARGGRPPPKLVHKMLLSMPPGTPPQKVLGAARNFAREEFGLQHRYAFVLHTDEPHPHVHLVVKAMSEQGVRLNIKKATLRQWRSEFARHLRELGVPANATERAVRGENRKSWKDGIYRASKRGESTFVRQRAMAVASALASGQSASENGKVQLNATRAQVAQGWEGVARKLAREGRHDLAVDVKRYRDCMSASMTDREWMAKTIQDNRRTTSDRRIERER